MTKHEKKMEKIALDIRKYLKEEDLWYDTRIYFNSMCFCSNTEGGIIEDINPKDYFEYANPKTLSMSFEGPLYEVINYGDGGEGIRNILEKYGYYFELGNAWNLSIYEL